MANRPDELIGINSDDAIDAVAARVSAALGLTLRPRESSYWGDPYYSGSPDSEIKLTTNLDPMFAEGDPPAERWFSSIGDDAAYLLWDVDDPETALAALSEVGLDAKAVQPN